MNEDLVNKLVMVLIECKKQEMQKDINKVNCLFITFINFYYIEKPLSQEKSKEKQKETTKKQKTKPEIYLLASFLDFK